MSLSTDTSTTDQKLADLRAILSLPPDQIRKTKGSALGRWEGIIASLLGDESGAVDQDIEDARGRLPSRVIASAAVQAWKAMSSVRRKNYLQWIEGLDAEKAAVHRITLTAGLVHKDPDTSQTQLASVSLNSKENIARLTDELLNRHSEELNELLPADAPLYKVHKISQCLVRLAGHERAVPQARYHTLRNVLVAIHPHLGEGKSMFDSVFDGVAKVLDSLPANLHRQLAEDLLESAPELHSRFFPNDQIALGAPSSLQLPLKSDASAPLAIISPGPSVSTPSAATSPESDQTNPKVSETPAQPNLVESGKPRPSLTSSIELFQLFDDASHYIRAVEEDRDLLRADLSSRIRQAESLDATLAEVRQERDSALERLATAELASEALTSRIGELSTELQKAREDSNSAGTRLRDIESRAALLNARVSELTGEKQRLTTEAAKEKEALARQVQGTAETRIDEIKKDIGFAVRRVVRDIPDKSTKVSPESAQRIFIRLHEVLSELERRGIRVKGE
jgi:hypothetical protein